MKTVSVLLFLMLLVTAAAAEKLLICSSRVLHAPISEAAKMVEQQAGEFRVGTADGSSNGIAMVGTGQAQLAACSRALRAEDRSNFPQVTFTCIYLGEQVLSLCVSRDVWQSGIHSLSRKQIQSIYEGQLKNWKDLGGPDQRIRFLNRPEGGGTWEVFAEWLYGDNRKAPLGKFQSIAQDSSVKEALADGRGAIAPLSPVFADNTNVYALALAEAENLQPQKPSAKNLLSRKFKMSRPLFLVFDDKPTGSLRAFVDFLLSQNGQEVLSRHGLLTRSAIEHEIGEKLPLGGPVSGKED